MRFIRDIMSKLDVLIANTRTIMHTLDDTLAEVTAESTTIESVRVLVVGLEKQLADALAGTTLPADVQAKVDAIFTAAQANKNALAAAVITNTPAPNPDPVPPAAPAA